MLFLMPVSKHRRQVSVNNTKNMENSFQCVPSFKFRRIMNSNLEVCMEWNVSSGILIGMVIRMLFRIGN